MTPAELEKIFLLCKKYGVTKLKMGEVEVEMAEAVTTVQGQTGLEGLTPEEILFHSVEQRVQPQE